MIRVIDPPWLKNVIPDDPESLPEPGKRAMPSTVSAPTVEMEDPHKPPTAYSKPKPKEPSATPPADKHKTVAMRINRLNRLTIRQVRQACVAALDMEQGKTLHLTDAQGATLIDLSMGIRVNPESLAASLYELNLSDGDFVER